jgi:TonB-dependent starch-binding outer membrane protein SusC
MQLTSIAGRGSLRVHLIYFVRIMKLTAIILLAACLSASARSNGQTITLKVKDAPLREVFREIQRQTGMNVIVKVELLNQAKPVTLNVSNMPVGEVLTICFKNGQLGYSIVDGTIVVEKMPVTERPLPPPITIKGRLVNENGEAVAATVLIKGTTRGIAAKPTGEFELTDVDENATLLITGISIEPLEIKVNGKTDLGAITVKMKVAGLGEVIINKGYYSEKQKYATGNVGKVTSKEIERQPVANVLGAVQGRVAGVTILQESGMPGSPFTVRIRGNNSIASGNEPLYIVDGVPFESTVSSVMVTNTLFDGPRPSTLQLINPQDIESIEILKDADATAIYGSRGANGVVLITTKKAKAGRTATSFNISHGIGQIGHRLKLMNKEQYLDYRMLAFRTAGATPTAADLDVNGAWANNPEIDWIDKLVGNNAQYTDAQLSFSGGNANTQFLVNGAWHKETSVLPKESPYSRASVLFSITNSSNDKRFNLQVSGNFSSISSDLPYSDLKDALFASPNSPAPLTEDGKINWATDWNNPYGRLEGRTRVNNNNLFGSAILSYKIWKGITARITGSYNKNQVNDNNTIPTTFYRPALNILTGSANFSYNNSQTWNVEPQLNYEMQLGKGTFAALAGSTFQENKSDNSSIFATGYTDNGLLGNLAGAATIAKGQFQKSVYRYRGLYMRLNYNLHDKYVVNLTARRDGSSRFAPAYRFRNFGSVGAAWLFSNEDFLRKAMPFVSFGKLRASYGVVGNDQFADYRYLDLYTYTNFAQLYQASQGLFPGNLYNPDLVWEKNKKLEVGMELGFLKDRINVSASWYRNRSDNQIVQYPLPITTGFANVWTNLPAVVQNTGWELTLNTFNIDGRNFKWRTSFNITDQHNKLVSFPGLELTTYRNTLVVGQPLSAIKVLKYAGVDPLNGLYTFVTALGNITYTPNTNTDRYFPVNTDPGIFGGLGNNLTYKGFELDVFFQFSKRIRENPLFYGSQHGGYFNRGTFHNNVPEMLNAWQKPGDITDVQRLSPLVSNENSAYGNAKNSDFNYMDASYVKLKNVSLSWQFPQTLRKKLHLQNGRAYLMAQNLFTITRYKGWDPEMSYGVSNLPPLRTITAGIQFTF